MQRSTQARGDSEQVTPSRPTGAELETVHPLDQDEDYGDDKDSDADVQTTVIAAVAVLPAYF